MKVEITPSRLRGTIDAIPSKSHAHRILLAQKLAWMQGQRIENRLEVTAFSDDIQATKDCLVHLEDEVPYLDCHESGSTLRFLLPVAMALKSEAVFAGKGKLPKRPISPLKEEMELHGCEFCMNSESLNGEGITEDERNTTEICRIRGKLQPGAFRLAGNISSQFITGLLYALPVLDGDSTLELTTELESAGYIDLTLKVLRDFGIKIIERKTAEGMILYEIPGNQRYVEPENLAIEGDWSNAAFWLACGALGGEITCRGLDMDSTQRDKEMVDFLKAMGAEIQVNGLQVSCRGRALNGMKEVSVRQVPDLVPVLAAVMALAEGTSAVTEAERLKIKESDRLLAVEDFLTHLGSKAKATDSGLEIKGAWSLTGGTVKSHNDHRIAMAAAVASCGCVNPVIIESAEAVRKSYPGFFEDFRALGGKVKILED